MSDSIIEIQGKMYKLSPFKEGGICKIFKGMPERRHLPLLAIKTIRDKWVHHDKVRSQFHIETKIVKDFDDIRLPHYAGRGMLNSVPFYAYHFVEGTQVINLSQRPDLYPPDLISSLALRMVIQLFETLEYIHEKMNPVVHGDISSENVVINPSQQLFLIDFGCAHPLNQSIDNRSWVGKPSFLSPEQAQGKIWDQRSDLYQVGILYYELVTRVRWNTGKDTREKHLFAASAPRPKLDFLAHKVHISLSMIFAKVLHPDPKSRFQTAAQVLRALYAAKCYEQRDRLMQSSRSHQIKSVAASTPKDSVL